MPNLINNYDGKQMEIQDKCKDYSRKIENYNDVKIFINEELKKN